TVTAAEPRGRVDAARAAGHHYAGAAGKRPVAPVGAAESRTDAAAAAAAGQAAGVVTAAGPSPRARGEGAAKRRMRGAIPQSSPLTRRCAPPSPREAGRGT